MGLGFPSRQGRAGPFGVFLHLRLERDRKLIPALSPCPFSLPPSPGKLQMCLGTSESRVRLERANIPWIYPKQGGPWTLPAPGAFPEQDLPQTALGKQQGRSWRSWGFPSPYPGNPKIFLPSLLRESLPCSFQSPNLARCSTQTQTRVI